MDYNDSRKRNHHFNTDEVFYCTAKEILPSKPEDVTKDVLEEHCREILAAIPYSEIPTEHL